MTTPATAPNLPQPPFFEIPNLNNLRDAALFPGGLTISSHQKVRPGLLFRSAEVSKLDRSGWAQLRKLGVGHVFDLRSTPEVLKGWEGVTGATNPNPTTNSEPDVRPGWMQDLEAEGLHRTFTPVFPESDYSPERLAERYMKYMGESTDGFVHAYMDILRHAGEAFGVVLRYLAELEAERKEGGEKARGALIHCTAGKDRTGIFFGVLLSFLGVERERIAEEYQLTELGLAHVREDIVARLSQSPGFKKYTLSQLAGREVSAEEIADGIKEDKEKKKEGQTQEEGEQAVPPDVLEKGRQAALRMLGAKKKSMLGALDMVDREWGSAEGYLRKVCGLGDGVLGRLKRNLVVER
ncbi:hypothetical protein K491DRAFT_757532 [Lophiostoma macrostomum CBS 122681]|uniref:Tyrosine specific protein phosphatases domain-containing protein n=1 Tax=Lophiostoma macrostomum CBS 122681 TaxID=1314788 RepID=A0A6A6TC06_9PLEO|nr:hypothetical protein K491DRAFT_757532 [Lophiostoma macrostomum CBS 122681]